MTYKLEAQPRELKTSGSLNEARKDGLVPVVIYGHGFDNLNGVVKKNDFTKIADQAGESSLIEVVLEGHKDPITVLIKDVQYDPVKGDIIHADLHAIKMDEEVTAEVKLKFVNDAPAVKEMGGNLVTARDTLTIKCLPKDLIASIEVDLSPLVTFEEAIHVSDLKIPEGVEIQDDAKLTLATVVAPKVETEPVATTAAEGEESAEGEDKKEGEESAEGEEKKEEKADDK